MRQNKIPELLAGYQQHLRRRGLAPTSRSAYAYILRVFCELDPTKRTTASIEGWLDDRKLGPKARRTYVQCINGFYRWLIDTGVMETNPATRCVTPRAPKRYPRPIVDDDLTRALDAAGVRMKAWLCLAAYAGLRCKEIAGLKVQDMRLDVDPPVLHLTTTKGNKERIVPLADEVRAALAEYDVPTFGPVFPALDRGGKRTHEHIKAPWVSKEINTFLHSIGIRATAHQLRHWFGTEVYRRTLNPLLVRDLMGHSDLATTSGYMALVPSAEAAAVLSSLSVRPPDAEKADP